MSDAVRITRAIEFSSSLRIRRGDLPDAENRRLFGRAAERHGHNYRLEVSLRGEPDPRTGMLVDLKDVKELLEREVMARFDHRDLNDDTALLREAAAHRRELRPRALRAARRALPAGLLERVRLYEGPDHWVDVERGGAA